MCRGESGIVLPWDLLVAIGLGWTARRANRGAFVALEETDCAQASDSRAGKEGEIPPRCRNLDAEGRLVFAP